MGPETKQGTIGGFTPLQNVSPEFAGWYNGFGLAGSIGGMIAGAALSSQAMNNQEKLNNLNYNYAVKTNDMNIRFAEIYENIAIGKNDLTKDLARIRGNVEVRLAEIKKEKDVKVAGINSRASILASRFGGRYQYGRPVIPYQTYC